MGAQKVLESYNTTVSSGYQKGKSGWSEWRYKIRTGQDNADVRKATGKWPPSNYSFTIREDRSEWKGKSILLPNGKQQPIDSYAPVFTGVTFDYRRTELEAISFMKFLKLFEDLREFDIGVFLAELPEAVSHITKTATVLVESMLLLRRGKVGAAMAKLEIHKSKRAWVNIVNSSTGATSRKYLTSRQHRKMLSDQIYDRKERLKARVEAKLITKEEAKTDFFKFVSERWLELQYGWYPLISDTDKLVKLAVLGVEAKPPPVKLQISTRRDLRITQDFTYGQTTLHEGNIRIGYEADIELASPVTLAPYAFGIDQAKRATWEAIPFSFVIDWFVPVGKYIEGLNFPEGVKVLRVNRTEKVRVNYSMIGIVGPGWTAAKSPYLGNSCSGIYTYFQRRINATPPSLSIPGVISLSNLSGWTDVRDNMITSIALLKTIFLNPK